MRAALRAVFLLLVAFSVVPAESSASRFDPDSSVPRGGRLAGVITVGPDAVRSLVESSGSLSLCWNGTTRETSTSSSPGDGDLCKIGPESERTATFLVTLRRVNATTTTVSAAVPTTLSRRLYITLESGRSRAVVQSLRDVPIGVRSMADVVSRSAGALLERAAAARESVTVALYIEPIHLTSLNARLEVPVDLRKASTEYSVRLKNQSFSTRFTVTITNAAKSNAEALLAVSWTVLRPTLAPPDLVAGVYATDGSLISSAVVRRPSPSGITFRDLFGGALSTDTITTARARLRAPLGPNGTTSTARVVPASSAVSSSALRQALAAPTSDSTASSTGRQTANGPRILRFHLVADFHERYREQFGELLIRRVQDDLLDVLASTRGSDLAVTLPLASRAAPWLTGGDSASGTANDTVAIRFSMPVINEGAAADLHSVTLSLSFPTAASNVQLVVMDGDGVVVFSADDDALAANGSPVRRDDADSPSRLYRSAIKAPTDGFAGDQLRVLVRFDDADAGAHWSPDEPTARKSSSPVGAGATEEVTAAVAQLALATVEAAGAWLTPLRLQRSATAAAGGVFQTRRAESASTILAVIPETAMLRAETVRATVPAVRRLLSSVEWNAMLRRRGLTAEPHGSAVALALGLLLRVPFPASTPQGNDALYSLVNRTMEQLPSLLPTLWPEAMVEWLFGLPDSPDDHRTAVGAEIAAHHAQWRAEYEVVNAVTNLAFAYSEYSSARALAAFGLRALPAASRPSSSSSAPRIVFDPFLGLFTHDDVSPSVLERAAELLPGGAVSSPAAATSRPAAAAAATDEWDASDPELQAWRRRVQHRLDRSADGSNGAGGVPRCFLLLSRRDLVPSEVLTVDRSGRGALTDVEVFTRFGAVARTSAAKAVLLDDVHVRVDRAGAERLLQRAISSAAGNQLEAADGVARAWIATARSRLSLRLAMLSAQQPPQEKEAGLAAPDGGASGGGIRAETARRLRLGTAMLQSELDGLTRMEAVLDDAHDEL
jgi:hypothetical protein